MNLTAATVAQELIVQDGVQMMCVAQTPDTTVPVVQAMQAELPNVRLLRNDLGRGVLNAMKSGIAAARGEYVLITMADGSDEVELVDAMVGLARGGADVVAASRYMKGGRQEGGPLLKRTLSRLAGLSLHWVGRLPIHDATNNFKLYRRAFLNGVTIESKGGFELAIELSVKADLAGRRLAEVAREAALTAERAVISDTLKQVHWNRRKAAVLLGVSYKTLLNKIKETGLEQP